MYFSKLFIVIVKKEHFYLNKDLLNKKSPYVKYLKRIKKIIY